jgi:hypothetical protein
LAWTEIDERLGLILEENGVRPHAPYVRADGEETREVTLAYVNFDPVPANLKNGARKS